MADEGVYILAKREEHIVGVTPVTARAAVQIARAKSVWPVAIVCTLLLAVVTLVLYLHARADVVWPLAAMIAPVGIVTIWRVLGKKSD